MMSIMELLRKFHAAYKAINSMFSVNLSILSNVSSGFTYSICKPNAGISDTLAKDFKELFLSSLVGW
jgi:hypothetical protein